jgi:hypothetical protein
MRVRGLPTTGSIADADADLRQALAGSDWITAGETVVRLYRPPTLFAFLGGFEIAVRVAAQGGGRHTGGDLGTPAMPQGPGRA